MPVYYTDLHIHIGFTSRGVPVKMATARNLTVENILDECSRRKGIQVVGLVDCLLPAVRQDIEALAAAGKLTPLSGGGFTWQGKVTLILGAELETKEANGCRPHYLCYFPDLPAAAAVGEELAPYVKNIAVAAEKCRLRAEEVFRIVARHGGISFPAHIFTPYKSVYGKCADALAELFAPETLREIPAVELGLSADTDLADTVSELAPFTFLSNSDAHSLPKIGREYNRLQMERPDFRELVMALRRREGRAVIANIGLDPVIGKYHRTYCNACGQVAAATPPVYRCPGCGSGDVVFGVLDRIAEIRDRSFPVHPPYRPPYQHQIPLEFIPGVGPKTLDRLIEAFGSEMAVLHAATDAELAAAAGPELGKRIALARRGRLSLNPGGGGRYGKLELDG